MSRVIVRYKVKPDRAQENEQLIEKVFAELAQTTPAGLRYASFKGEDGVTFFHFASIETEGGANPLDDSPAFQTFQEGIRDRCDEPPEVVQLKDIGSYLFFDS
jgi:quinol monooxygenase YgiN